MADVEILNLTERALLLSLMLSLPPIVVAAGVGVLVSLVQALTQVQEQTLGFAIKLIAVVLVIFMTAQWLGDALFKYTVLIFDNFPNLVG